MSSNAAPSAVPAVGTPAPDFALRSTSGETVALSALRGRRVLLAFFPAAFTSVCTAEMCAMRDEYEVFEAENVTVLPISVDPVDTLQRFKAEHGLQVELLSDEQREAGRAYGVLLEPKLVANRAYFLVGGDGTLRWVHVEEHPGFRRENAEILAAIRAAI
jgi:peroxiredoxin